MEKALNGIIEVETKPKKIITINSWKKGLEQAVFFYTFVKQYSYVQNFSE
jgi:hypothetical protein